MTYPREEYKSTESSQCFPKFWARVIFEDAYYKFNYQIL